MLQDIIDERNSVRGRCLGRDGEAAALAESAPRLRAELTRLAGAILAQESLMATAAAGGMPPSTSPARRRLDAFYAELALPESARPMIHHDGMTGPVVGVSLGFDGEVGAAGNVPPYDAMGGVCPRCGKGLSLCSPSGNGRAACDHCQTWWE